MSEEVKEPQGENQEVTSAAQNQDDVNTEETKTITLTEPNDEDNAAETTDNTEITKEDFSKVDTTDDTKVAETLSNKGFDFEKLQEEFNTHGDITKETREALAKQGITEEILNGYIEGRMAIVQRQMTEIAETVGGQEQFETIVNWAKANLSEDEKKAIDKVHDPSVIKIILKDLKGRMEAADGYVPQQLMSGGSTAGDNYFHSMAEVEDAINDPRYSKDEVYRNNIGQKIHASRVAGVLDLH